MGRPPQRRDHSAGGGQRSLQNVNVMISYKGSSKVTLKDCILVEVSLKEGRPVISRCHIGNPHGTYQLPTRTLPDYLNDAPLTPRRGRVEFWHRASFSLHIVSLISPSRRNRPMGWRSLGHVCGPYVGTERNGEP